MLIRNRVTPSTDGHFRCDPHVLSLDNLFYSLVMKNSYQIIYIYICINSADITIPWLCVHLYAPYYSGLFTIKGHGSSAADLAA